MTAQLEAPLPTDVRWPGEADMDDLSVMEANPEWSR